jgi:hypothetical protein
MTGKSLRLTRMLVSKKFAPPKSADERALEFLASKKEIVSKSFDAELSVKALGKNTGKKPPSADNKEKRKKGKGPNKRFGLAVFDPNAKKKTGQIFIPWIAQWGRTGSDEYPNFGWIDPIKELKPNQTNARMFQASEKKKNGVSVTYSDVVRNPRTGEFDTKSLGRTIGQLVPGGEIATRAASALGLWQDAAGKLRCPPGVPAANQFTDSSGSNCFDITEGMASRLLRSAINQGMSLLDDMSLLNEAISRPTVRDGRGMIERERELESLREMLSGSSVVRGLASAKPRREFTNGERTVWLPADDMDLITEAAIDGFKPTGRVDTPAPTRPIIKVDAVPEEPKSADDLIGPDSLPISRIDAKSFAEEVRARVLDAHPDITPEELNRIVMLAEQKARMTDAMNGRIDVALQLMKDLGIDVDPSSPQSVSAGFMRAMDELSKSGWDINFENTLWTDVDRTLSREEQVAQHHANVLNMIVQNMVKDPEGTLEARDASVVKRLWAGLSKKKKEEAVRNATMAYLNGDAPETLKTDLEKALHRNMAHRMNNYLAAEHGFMLGMLAEHKMNPGKAELLKRVGVMDPMDPRNEGIEAMVIPDADGQISMLWNPLGMILADNPPAPKNPKAWRLYGTSGSGLEVSKIAEVKKTVDSATKMAMLNDMLGGDVFDAIKTHGYMGDIAKKHGGSIGHAMFVFQHELTHAQQYAMVMYMISHDKKGRRITTLSNVELAKLADDIITGNFPGLTMEMLFADEKAMAAVHGKVGVVMDSMVREGMSGIYPRMHLETMHILNKIMGLKDDERPGFISDLEDRFATLRERAGFDKDLTPDEQMELKILNHAIGTIRGIDEFDDEQLQNSVRTQRALMFAESAAELNAARAMGIIDPTDEKVTAALAHLDAPMDKVAKEVVAVKESKKRKWLERLVSAVELYDELKNTEFSLEQASSGDEPLTINLVRRKRWREGDKIFVSEDVAPGVLTVSLEERSGIPRGFSKLTPEGEYEPLRAGDIRGFAEAMLRSGVEKTKPFKGRASARSHGKKMRDDLMATATPMEISAMEKTMPERMDGRILTSPAHVSYSVAESAKIRKGLASGKTFDKRIEEDIAPLLSVMDRHALDDDYTVIMDMDIPGREGLVTGSSVEVSNMFRGIIADKKTVLTPTREESGTRMVLMLPRGTSAIPDEDFMPGRNKEKSYSALLMPPGKIEVVGRQDDGTIVARLVEQASPNEVLSSMRGPLEEIIANPNISASRKMEAQKAINAIDAARSINLPVGKRGDDRVARMSSVGLSSAKDRIGAKSHKYFDDALKQVEEAASTWQGMNPSTKNAIKYGTTIAMTASSAWLGRKNTKISNWMDDFDEHEIDFAEELLNVWDAGGPTLAAHTIASTKNMIYQAQDRFEKSGMKGSDFRAKVDDMFNGIKKDITEKLANGNRRLGEMSTNLRTNFMENINRALSSMKKEKVDAAEVVEIERDLGRGLASRRGYSANTPSTKPPTGLASQKHPGIKRLANVTPLRAQKEGVADAGELDTTEVSSLLKDEILTDIFDMADEVPDRGLAKWMKLRKEALKKPSEKIVYTDKDVLARAAKSVVSAHIGDALSEQFTIEELVEAGKFQAQDVIPYGIDGNIFQTISDIADSYKNGNGEPVTFWYVPETGTLEKERFRGTDGEYEPYTSDYIEFSYPSDEGNKALYDFAASTLVKQWQITSNDSNVTSLRVQDVAREIFELNDSLGWRSDIRDRGAAMVLSPEEHVSLPISDAQKKLLTVFINAQYAQTQEYLNKKGIKKLTVYRGFTDDALEYSLSNNGNFPEDGITDAELELRPLSSFSVDPRIAWAFGQLVIESEIDAKDVIALPLTGSGCLNESEVIVLGRSGLTGTIRAKNDFGKRLSKIEAEKTSALQAAELDKFAQDLIDIPPPPDWTGDF